MSSCNIITLDVGYKNFILENNCHHIVDYLIPHVQEIITPVDAIFPNNGKYTSMHTYVYN